MNKDKIIKDLKEENEKLKERIKETIGIIDCVLNIGVKDYASQLEIIKDMLLFNDDEDEEN